MVNKIFLGVAVAILLVAGFVFFTSGQPGKYDEFAQCLSSKGAKMYGAYWCPHCNEQKSEFASSWKFVKYVECSLPNNGGQTQECNAAGITSYPTWQFADGNRLEGRREISELAAKMGCALPE